MSQRCTLPAGLPRTLFAFALITLAIGGCATQPELRYSRQQHNPDDGRDNSGLAHSNSLGLASSRARRPSNDDALENALYEYYQQWNGVPYRYGGRGENGIDCSSFVRQTLGRIESLDLPRTTNAQVVRGRRIDRSDLSPGDLVFFKTGGSGRHVGVYVGNGRFMHASSSKGVTISRLDNLYWRRHYWQSRRVTPVIR